MAGRPAKIAEAVPVNVRVEAKTLTRLEKLAPKLSPVVPLTQPDVIRAAIDAGVTALEKRFS